MNSTVRKTIIFFSIIFIPFIVVITCPFIGYMGYLAFDRLFGDRGPSIETTGLEGCDTVPLAGDKQQLAEAFMANVDAKWIKLNKLDKEIELPEVCDSVNDPLRYYTFLCYRYCRMGIGGGYERLTIYPSKFYKAFTDLVLYSKDKLLCMAFIVLRNDLNNGLGDFPPYFDTYVVIGKREKMNEPFRLFIRPNSIGFITQVKKNIQLIENDVLYREFATCRSTDVFYSEDSKPPLPLPSDPDFFEKHPLFEKFDDSTYNFEWYKTEGTPEKYYRYDYPY